MKIKDLAKGGVFSDGDWVESKDQDVNGEIRLIQLADIGDGNFIDKSNRYMNKETAQRLKCTYLKKGDILIARMPDPIGRCCLFPFDEKEKYVTVVDICVVRIKESHHLKYIKYAINSPLIRRQIEKQVTGTTRLRITKKKIGELEIPLPPLATQKKIAAILDAADAHRQKTKQLLAKYDALAQSIFLEMFGDPVTNPKGWEIVKFEDLVAKDCPLTYGIVQPGEEFDSGVICVRPVDLTMQYVNAKGMKRINPLISSKFQRTLLKGGELMLSVRGSIGVISIADESLKGANVTRGIVPIWFDSNISDKLFFYYLYKSIPIQRRLGELSKGATLIQINLKDLREMELIKPPIEKQRKFGDTINELENQKKLLEKSKSFSDILFNSLLNKALKGELVK